MAPKQAATSVKDSLEPCSPTVFLTDALSVLEALQINKSPLLATQMQELGNTCCSPMDHSKWGITGNEQADQLPKCEAQDDQHPLPGKDHHHQNTLKPRQEKDAYHLLDRPGQVVLARLRSGHNRLNAHVQRELKKSFLPQRVPVVRRTRQPSMFFRNVTYTNIILGLGGPEDDHQLHHCC